MLTFSTQLVEGDTLKRFVVLYLKTVLTKKKSGEF